jgi:hypothetical protein
MFLVTLADLIILICCLSLILTHSGEVSPITPWYHDEAMYTL